ncbi:glycosyltransferase family 2 protein [Nocardioides sp. R-C-SC26]|uniref:glycosyltransferase family 2 protein n=1 Tax=Nocardioides sp. R-C-SC26 TaxID=2870414 RepID=UPI001E59008C|nr:glycosyltransferase family 2 protein [Nocardioides sp. R-C-SC26]
MARRRIAFVLPVYDEVESLTAFHAALTTAIAERPDLEFELVYVDDGSRDGSLDLLLELREADDRVAVLGLSRNCGHQIAVTAGLGAVGAADAVVVMDTDLQDPPAVALELIARWEQGADVVYAQRRTRRDSRFKRTTAWGFYRLLSRVASIEIPRNVGDFRLMDRRVVAEVGRYREHDRFLRGIVAHVGFRQEAVLYDREHRHAGRTKYPLRSMVALASAGIVGFSTAPLRWISRLGFAISFMAVLVAAYVLYVRVFNPEDAVPGWAFLGVGMFLLGGIQLIMMGVIGTYLGRVYTATQNRPLYSIALVARGSAETDPSSR